MIAIRVFHAGGIFLITFFFVFFVLFVFCFFCFVCFLLFFFLYIYKLKFPRNYKLSFSCNLNNLFCSSILSLIITFLLIWLSRGRHFTLSVLFKNKFNQPHTNKLTPVCPFLIFRNNRVGKKNCFSCKKSFSEQNYHNFQVNVKFLKKLGC